MIVYFKATKMCRTGTARAELI